MKVQVLHLTSYGLDVNYARWWENCFRVWRIRTPKLTQSMHFELRSSWSWLTRQTSRRSADLTKKYHDKNLREFVYEPGDKVWLEDHTPRARGRRKLVQQFDGSWYILNEIGEVNYRMSLGPGFPIKIHHHNKLYPYETLPGQDTREIPEWIMKASFTLRLRAKIQGYRFVKRTVAPGRRPLRCCAKRRRIIREQKKHLINKARKRCRPGKPRVLATITPATLATGSTRTRAGRISRKPDRLIM